MTMIYNPIPFVKLVQEIVVGNMSLLQVFVGKYL